MGLLAVALYLVLMLTAVVLVGRRLLFAPLGRRLRAGAHSGDATMSPATSTPTRP